jgi:hypothetical protein
MTCFAATETAVTTMVRRHAGVIGNGCRCLRRGAAGAAGLAAVATMLAGGTVHGQPAVKTAIGPSHQQLPRTPDGHPDLQGTYSHGTLTPFERPEALGDKAFYTEEEAREAERQATARRANRGAARPGDVGGDNEAFVDSGYTALATRQTSLIVEPPDGRLPLTPAAEKRRDFNLTSMDSYESMSPWDRCITRGPTLMLPTGYNNGTRITQTPAYVVIESEMIHEARIVPLDRRTHADARLRSWTGDPIGRWDGDTLVVDSTNFTDKGWVSTHAGSGRLRGIPNSDALHLIERFTLTDHDTITYELTVDDPDIYTRPWKVSLPLRRDPAYEMFEYACHEGNQAIELALRGARFEERQAAGTPKP